MALVNENPDTKYILRFMMKPNLVDEIIEYSKSFQISELSNAEKEFTPIRGLGPQGKFISEIVDDYTKEDIEKIVKIQQRDVHV